MGTYISQWPVAVLGLGTGSVVQYMAAKQPVDFYEVDKLVEHIAKTYFSFLKKSDAIVDVKIGDGRVELQKAPEGHYGFILMDAFSSDAIPSHLLTKEAFKMYLSKLRPDGVIIVNIANRYVNLYPMLRSLAKDLNLTIARGSSTVENKAKLIYPSEWVAFSPAAGRLDALNATKIWQTDNLDGITHASWKDDFIDIRSILRK
jgi:spermidine synthase